MRKKLLLILALALLVLPIFVFAEGSTSTPDPILVGLPNVPGTQPLDSGPAGMIYNIYIIALWLGGILAFGSILFGGIQYLSARGSTEAVSSAKNRLQNAILGLLLLVGIYVLLGVINPDLTNLRLPTLQRLEEPKQVSTSSLQQFDPAADVYACKSKDKGDIRACFVTQAACELNCNVDSAGFEGAGNEGTETCSMVKGSDCNARMGLPAPGQCSSGPCVVIDIPGWPIKNGNKVDPKLLTELKCIAEKGVTLRITEAMPPSSPHKSIAHLNGCAVDATIPTVTKSVDCSKVCDAMSTINSCASGKVLNEYFNLCKNTSCPGTHTELATADHIHISSLCTP